VVLNKAQDSPQAWYLVKHRDKFTFTLLLHLLQIQTMPSELWSQTLTIQGLQNQIYAHVKQERN